MYIESLELKNFRNYHALSVSFDRGVNIFYGDNAQGKTNILESIYLCGTTKSHKGSKDKEIIRFHEEESHIRMLVNKDGASYRIDMHLKKNRPKGIAIGGIPIHRAAELFGVVNLVFFSPEDLNIIKNGPAERRHFIDAELCQLDRLYLADLAAYQHILNQRNRHLKDNAGTSGYLTMLDVFDEQLFSYGKKIMEARTAFVAELNALLTGIHADLTEQKEKIRISYEPNTNAAVLEEKIRENREKDLRFKTSTTGPHRDDLLVCTNGIDIRKYGSQGQQRTAALSLKMAEISLVEKRIHDTPILLLDDVLSELDQNRQNCLLNSIHHVQTFMTCTGLDDFVRNRFLMNRVFRVINGTVQMESEKTSAEDTGI